MSYGIRKLSTRTKLLVGALALVIAGLSHATGTLVGGGATLPSLGYVGTNAATELQVDGSSISSTSLFGVYESTSGVSVSYCLTGSGAGKDILAGGTIGTNTYSVQNACTKNSAGTVLGFGAPAVGRTDLTQPNFAAADSPLAQTDYNNYQAARSATGSTTVYPTQFPAVAGAIAIGFNLIDSKNNVVTSSEVNFTDAQVCEIFSGVITNWDDSRLTSAFTLTDGGTIPSGTINVLRNEPELCWRWRYRFQLLPGDQRYPDAADRLGWFQRQCGGSRCHRHDR
jgi:phosphate transport system substrate-binding protein